MSATVRFIDIDGFTTITVENMGNVFAGLNQVPRKLGFQSTSDRELLNVFAELQQVGTSDGSALLRMAADSASVSPTVVPPWDLSASVGGASGAWALTGTYGYKIASRNSIGESGPSPEITAVVDLVTRRVTLTWTQVPGANGYFIYRTPTPGTYGASTLVTTIGSGATVSYNDDGAATSSGTPKTRNTTGGWIATPTLSGAGAGGVWSGTGLKYYRVVALDATGVEIANSLQASINVDNTTKTVTLNWPAVASAVSFKVYRSTIDGDFSGATLRATTAGPTSYIDNGAATGAGSLVTLPSYGIPPTSFSSADIVVGDLQINQEFYLWLKCEIPGGTPEISNPRQALLAVLEA